MRVVSICGAVLCSSTRSWTTAVAGRPARRCVTPLLHVLHRVHSHPLGTHTGPAQANSSIGWRHSQWPRATNDLRRVASDARMGYVSACVDRFSREVAAATPG